MKNFCKKNVYSYLYEISENNIKKTIYIFFIASAIVYYKICIIKTIFLIILLIKIKNINIDV